MAVVSYLDVYPDTVGNYRQVEYRGRAAWADVGDLAGAGIVPDRPIKHGRTLHRPSQQALADGMALATLCDMVLPVGAPDRSNEALIKSVGALLQKASCTVIEQASEKGG